MCPMTTGTGITGTSVEKLAPDPHGHATTDMHSANTFSISFSFLQSTTNAGKKKKEKLPPRCGWGSGALLMWRKRSGDMGRAGAVTWRDERSIPVLPPAHGHILLMWSISRTWDLCKCSGGFY